MRVIFDSNVFDDIIAGRLDVSVLIRKRVKIYITNIRKMNWQHAGMSKDGLNYFSAWHR